MSTGWSNEETFKFIELYQNHPVIWNPKHGHHKDKNKVGTYKFRYLCNGIKSYYHRNSQFINEIF